METSLTFFGPWGSMQVVCKNDGPLRLEALLLILDSLTKTEQMHGTRLQYKGKSSIDVSMLQRFALHQIQTREDPNQNSQQLSPRLPQQDRRMTEPPSLLCRSWEPLPAPRAISDPTLSSSSSHFPVVKAKSTKVAKSGRSICSLDILPTIQECPEFEGMHMHRKLSKSEDLPRMSYDASIHENRVDSTVLPPFESFMDGDSDSEDEDTKLPAGISSPKLTAIASASATGEMQARKPPSVQGSPSVSSRIRRYVSLGGFSSPHAGSQHVLGCQLPCSSREDHEDHLDPDAEAFVCSTLSTSSSTASGGSCSSSA